jgi:hypothetical protein
MNLTNQNRVARLTKVLRGYETDDTEAGCLIDILADARHWCDRHNMDYARFDRLAYQHYLAERAEGQEVTP